MWNYFAFLFLYMFTSLFSITTRYHHVNEVFNAFGHDHIYSVVNVEPLTEEVYFNSEAISDVIYDHFKDNMKIDNYSYTCKFYYRGKVSTSEVYNDKLELNLKAQLWINVNYDKTFTYYIT